jgi:hypothetical protein
MKELTEANLPEFAVRYLFADGLIRFVRVAYARESAVGEVAVSVREGLNGSWVNIHFRVEGLESFTLRQPLNTTSQVLFDGVSVRWFGGLCYLDLSHDCADRTTPADYERADFLLVGRRCFWSSAPYSDAVPGI